MSRDWRDLAVRFRAALDAEEEARRRAEAERQRRLQEGRAAREALLSDLAEFASLVGPHVEAKRRTGGLTLQRGERAVEFDEMGDGDRVRVTLPSAEGQEHRLYREGELSDRWVWSSQRHGREDRQVLFTVGLEKLLRRGLGLPEPAAPGTVEPPALDPDSGSEPEEPRTRRL